MAKLSKQAEAAKARAAKRIQAAAQLADDVVNGSPRVAHLGGHEKAIAAWFASAPVRLPKFEPLDLSAPGLRIIRVSTEPLEVSDAGESWETHGHMAAFSDEHGPSNKGNNLAAKRAQLEQRGALIRYSQAGEECEALGDSGPDSLVAVLLETAPGVYRTIVVEGRLSAVAQAFPDRATLEAWKAAGVTEVPVWDLDQVDGDLRRVQWRPIAEAARVVQMEQVSRSLARRTGSVATGDKL